VTDKDIPEREPFHPTQASSMHHASRMTTIGIPETRAITRTRRHRFTFSQLCGPFIPFSAQRRICAFSRLYGLLQSLNYTLFHLFQPKALLHPSGLSAMPGTIPLNGQRAAHKCMSQYDTPHGPHERMNERIPSPQTGQAPPSGWITQDWQDCVLPNPCLILVL
jgi:hypothetical protein